MIEVLLWMRFVLLFACGALVSLYWWLGSGSD